jgi:hypothetical protein
MAASDKHILDTLQHIENEINSTLRELSSIKEEMDAELSDETNRVFKFIFNLQRSGFSQQFNVGECIEKHFGFSKEKTEKFLFNYIENLSEFTEKFSMGSEVSESSSHVSDSQSQQKKRKGPKPYSEMTPEELAIAKAKKLERLSEKKEPVSNELLIPTQSLSPLEPMALASLEPVAAASLEPMALASLEPVALASLEPVAGPETPVKPARRVLKKNKNSEVVKKNSDAIKIWNSFLKIVKAEMEATGTPTSYDDVVKRAKDMKEADKGAYDLFSATWTPEDDSLSSNS